jgi:hypothetical protein
LRTPWKRLDRIDIGRLNPHDGIDASGREAHGAHDAGPPDAQVWRA